MKTEFYLNGNKLLNFKSCDFIFFTKPYDYADIIEQTDNYCKIIFSDDVVEDVWEIKEYKEE